MFVHNPPTAPSHSYFEILTSKGNDINRWGYWEGPKSWGSSTFIRDPIELPGPFHCVRLHWRSLQPRKRSSPGQVALTSSHQNCEQYISVVCNRHIWWYFVKAVWMDQDGLQHRYLGDVMQAITHIMSSIKQLKWDEKIPLRA